MQQQLIHIRLYKSEYHFSSWQKKDFFLQGEQFSLWPEGVTISKMYQTLNLIASKSVLNKVLKYFSIPTFHLSHFNN